MTATAPDPILSHVPTALLPARLVRAGSLAIPPTLPAVPRLHAALGQLQAVLGNVRRALDKASDPAPSPREADALRETLRAGVLTQDHALLAAAGAAREIRVAAVAREKVLREELDQRERTLSLVDLRRLDTIADRFASMPARAVQDAVAAAIANKDMLTVLAFDVHTGGAARAKLYAMIDASAAADLAQFQTAAAVLDGAIAVARAGLEELSTHREPWSVPHATGADHLLTLRSAEQEASAALAAPPGAA